MSTKSDVSGRKVVVTKKMVSASKKSKVKTTKVKVNEGRLNAIIPKWHEHDIKYEYYYHPESKQLKATIGILKIGKKLYVSYTIASPKEKEVSKYKAKKIVELRIMSFVRNYGKDKARNNLTPIYMIDDYDEFLKNHQITNFRDILIAILDVAIAEYSLENMELDKITAIKNFIYHVKRVFSKFQPKFYLKNPSLLTA